MTGPSNDPLRTQLQASLGSSYTIERELGGGGMSRVFVAEETELRRTVVIKVLSPELAEGLNVERFRREIQVAARLQHPHIVPLLSAGQSGGLPYFTMPFISGQSLRNRLEAGGELPVAEAVRILREVASALAYAHANGVVHRDIKPDNVLLSGGAAMVTDFGVAKAIKDAANTAGSTLTQFGVALGTPAYMAPEQAAADPAVDHRADIYAYGAMAYELLTGEPPFAGRPAQAMLAAHAVETPESIARRRPAVPSALAALVMHCLEKRPADRPQTADDLIRALDGIQMSDGGIRATASRPAEPMRQARRSPSWLVGAALGLLLVVGAAAVIVVKQHDTPAAPSGQTMLAVLPFDNQGPAADQYFADGITAAITNRLASLHNLGVIDQRSAAQYKGTSKSPKQIGKELGVQYLLEGTVQWAPDEKGGRKVQISPALVDVNSLTTKPAGGPYLVNPADVFQVQTDVATKVADALNVALNGQEEHALKEQPTRNPQAYDAFLRGQAFDRQNDNLSPDAIRQAMDAYTEATRLDPTFALALAKLGSDQMRWAVLDLSDTTRITAAKRSMDSALALNPDLADGHVARARYLAFFLKDRAGEYDELARAHVLKPNNVEVLTGLANAQFVRGQIDSGFANIAKAVKLDPRGEDVILRAAQLAYRGRRYGEVAMYADKYIALAPTSPVGYNWKMNALIDGHGDTAQARQVMAVAIARGVRMNVGLASQYSNFGAGGLNTLVHLTPDDVHALQFLDSGSYYIIKRIAYVALGKTDLARALGDSILRIAKSPRLTGPILFARYSLLAWGYAAQLNRAEAMRNITDYEHYLAGLSPDDPFKVQAETQIATVFATMGMADSTIAHVRNVLAMPDGFSMWTAKTDAEFVPLRGNPAWERFLAGS